MHESHFASCILLCKSIGCKKYWYCQYFYRVLLTTLLLCFSSVCVGDALLLLRIFYLVFLSFLLSFFLPSSFFLYHFPTKMETNAIFNVLRRIVTTRGRLLFSAIRPTGGLGHKTSLARLPIGYSSKVFITLWLQARDAVTSQSKSLLPCAL